MQITTVGIDLAKNVFQIHRMNEHGKPVLCKQMRREHVTAFFANLPPCAKFGGSSEILGKAGVATLKPNHEEDPDDPRQDAARAIALE